MPQADTTRGNAGVKPRKKYKVPPTRSDAAQRTGAKPVKRRTAPNVPTYTPRSAGIDRSDAAVSGGAHGRKRAASWRKSPEGIAEDYLNAPAEKQTQLRKTAKGKKLKVIRAVERYFAERGRAGDRPYTDDERLAVEQYKLTPKFQESLKAGRAGRMKYENPELPDYALETDPKKLKAAGFAPSGALDKAFFAPYGAITSAAAVAEATYKDPIGVPKKTAKSLPLIAAGIPTALANTIIHPVKTGEGFAESIAADYDEKVKRTRAGGAVEDLGNAAILLGPSGSAIGRAAVVSRLGSRAAKLQTGGVAKTPKTRGALSFVAGHAIDKKRAAKYERLARKGKPLTALQHEALQANRAAGKAVAVVPFRSKRKIKVEGVAKPRGRAIAAHKYDVSRGDFDKMNKALLKLDKNEEKALWFAAEPGIRTPDVARAELPKLRARMLEGRGDYVPSGHERQMDVVALIDEVLENPEKHFTPKLREVMEQVGEAAAAISAREPQFAGATKEARRRAVQRDLLDLDQGVVPDAPKILEVAEPLDRATQKAVARRLRNGARGPSARNKITADQMFSTADIPVEKTGGTPDLAPNDAEWFHGTPNDFEGLPTAKGAWSDLGVYLTSDPEYTRGYAEKWNPDAGGRTLAIRVKAKKTLDMRAGREDPAELKRVVDAMLKKADDAGIKHLHVKKMAEEWSVRLGEGKRTTPESAGVIQDLLQGLSEEIARATGGAGTGRRHQVFANTLREMGYDSIRKVDINSDALVVLDESIMRRVTGTEGAPTTRKRRLKSVPPLRFDAEADADFHKRLDAAAAARGLAEPIYFKSEKQRGGDVDYAAMATGGAKAKSTGRQYQGKNYGVGIFDTSKSQLLRGYAHNVKAEHNYPLANDLVVKNNLSSITPEPQGVTIGEALNRVNRAEPLLKKDTVAFVNPGLFEQRLSTKLDDLDHATLEDASDAMAGEAMERAVLSPRQMEAIARAAEAGDEEALLLTQSPGWHAVPKEMLRELEAELKAGTPGGRALDIVKGNLSKALLITGNLPWLAIQFVSESAVAGLATKGRALTPQNIVGTTRWWKAMNHDQRMQVASAAGLGVTGSDLSTVRMGAAVQGGFINWYRGLKSADLWHKPRVADQPLSTLISPVQWMRKADIAKTNVTRLLTAHAELSKLPPGTRSKLADAMVGVAKHDKAVERLLPVFKKPAKEQLDYLTKHPEILEDVVETLNDYLGDWTTMTAAERKVINRAVMFYPFVRYSARLALWTMPTQHPAVMAMLAELSELTVEEYRETFGDEDLPWNLGKVYFGETGESTGIDLARANPLTNAAVSGLARVGTSTSNLPGAAIGMMPPYGQWLVDHLTGVNTYKGRPLRLGGETDPFWNKPWEISLEQHGKLAVSQVASLFYPYREAQQRLQPGTMSDESSLLFPVPMGYKKSSEIEGGGLANDIRRAKARAAEANIRFREENSGGLLDVVLGPLAPKPYRDAQSSRDRQAIEKLEQKQERQRLANKRNGGSTPKIKSRSSGGSGLVKSKSGSGIKPRSR
jgi:hypothetical protein